MRSSSAITLKLEETVGAVTSSSRSIHHYNPLPPLPPPQHVVVEEDENEQHKTPPDSDHLVVDIRERLGQACQDDVAATTWSIHKVPKYFRGGDEKSYMPQIVSIGPYHHSSKRKRMRSMDMHKWRFLQLFLNRTKHNDVKIYLNALKEVEDDIRKCYEGPISFGSDEFVKMMLLDGCFILELFQGAAEGFKNVGYPPVFEMRGWMHTIQRDLIMLENQLPLFVLDLLLGIQRGQPEHRGLVSKLALAFFDPLTPTDEPLTKSSKCWKFLCSKDRLESSPFDPLSDQGSLHCLEVFRRGLLGSGPQRPKPRIWSNSDRVANKRQQLQLIHCVTELREAGVKFKRRSTDRFWDVEFKNGVLKIPKLLIHDGTKSLFLNLIAFEQCHLGCSSDITSYVKFMDNLINSAADVGYLKHCDIIEHGLGSDAEVADMVNCLCQEVVFDASDSYLSTLSEEVNTYFNRKWNSWRASLKHTHFSNPWAIISLFAAVILLLLTLAQTFYTVYGYYIPRGN